MNATWETLDVAILDVKGDVFGEEYGEVRPGDVVFSLTGNPRMPLHVAIFVGLTSVMVGEDEAILTKVCGVPGTPSSMRLGIAAWNNMSKVGFQQIIVVGQRLDVSVEALREVVLIAEHVLLEHSQFAEPFSCWMGRQRAEFDHDRPTPWGRPLFVRGTCAQFVEYIYESAQLDLVDQGVTCPPDGERDVLPGAQMHAFFRGVYPLAIEWDEKLRGFTDCLFGTREVRLP